MVRCPFNISRGMRAKAEREGAPEANAPSPQADDELPDSREARRRWAALIQRVFEVDPLECPECGGMMRVISFIERRQTDVIERILRHCELWDLQIDPDPEYEQWLWESREAG